MLIAMFSGMPIAFAPAFVAALFMTVFMPASSLHTVTQNVYDEMSDSSERPRMASATLVRKSAPDLIRLCARWRTEDPG